MILRPMLATSEVLTVKDAKHIRYPKYVTRKWDGVRMLSLCRPEFNRAGCSPMSRAMKLLPNSIIQDWCESEGVAGFDGEIIIEGKSFHQINSWVSTNYAPPSEFKYVVFDFIGFQTKSYLQRLQILKLLYETYQPKHTTLELPKMVSSARELVRMYEEEIENGGEGLIVRDGDAPYKQGRATWNSQWMLKMKQFVDGEARILGFEEKMKNLNEAQVNELGFTRRSSHKANKRGLNTLGALVVQDLETGEVFNVGSGWDAELAQWIWDNRKVLRGEIITYKHTPHGVKDKPRTPIFKGIRKD